MRNASLVLPILVLSLAISSVAAGQDSAAALQKFSAELVELLRWSNEGSTATRGNLKAKAEHAAEFAKKVGELKVDGLPEELRGRSREFAAAALDVRSVLALAPKYAAEEAEEGRANPAKRADFEVKKRAALDRYNTSLSALTALIAKYRLTFRNDGL